MPQLSTKRFGGDHRRGAMVFCSTQISARPSRRWAVPCSMPRREPVSVRPNVRAKKARPAGSLEVREALSSPPPGQRCTPVWQTPAPALSVLDPMPMPGERPPRGGRGSRSRSKRPACRPRAARRARRPTASHRAERPRPARAPALHPRRAPAPANARLPFAPHANRQAASASSGAASAASAASSSNLARAQGEHFEAVLRARRDARWNRVRVQAQKQARPALVGAAGPRADGDQTIRRAAQHHPKVRPLIVLGRFQQIADTVGQRQGDVLFVDASCRPGCAQVRAAVTGIERHHDGGSRRGCGGRHPGQAQRQGARRR